MKKKKPNCDVCTHPHAPIQADPKIVDHMTAILKELGEDPSREGLKSTPKDMLAPCSFSPRATIKA